MVFLRETLYLNIISLKKIKRENIGTNIIDIKVGLKRRKEFEEDFKKRFMQGEFFDNDYENQDTKFTQGEYQVNDIHPVFKIKKSSSEEDFKKQYKKLILKHHPDKGGDSSMFIKIQEAWESIKLRFT